MRKLHITAWPCVLFALTLPLAGCLGEPHIVADPLPALLAKDSPLLPVFDSADELRPQILITRFVDKNGALDRAPTTEYRADAEYFYPASTIKLCAAVSALLDLRRSPVDTTDRDDSRWGRLYQPLAFHPLDVGEPIDVGDATNLFPLSLFAITIGHEIRKIFLVSDNPAYNRLYDFVGQQQLNRDMHDLGLRSVRLTHRLAVGHTPEQNRRSPRIDTMEASNWVQIKPARSYPPIPARASSQHALFDVGRDYATPDGPAGRPMNFADKNAISLRDLHHLTIAVVRPDAARLVSSNLTPPDLHPALRQFLLQAMSEYPADSLNPRYDRAEYPDEWGKYFLPGLCRVRPKHEWTIWNKVGMAYGFLTDTAVIRHDPTGRTLAITATIYCNADGVLNDDRYDYDTVGFPFFADLGEYVGRALAPLETQQTPLVEITPQSKPVPHNTPTPTPTGS